MTVLYMSNINLWQLNCHNPTPGRRFKHLKIIPQISCFSLFFNINIYTNNLGTYAGNPRHSCDRIVGYVMRYIRGITGSFIVQVSFKFLMYSPYHDLNQLFPSIGTCIVRHSSIFKYSLDIGYTIR